MKNKKKLMILAPARWGKDTVAELLEKLAGYKFVSSSEFACKKVVFPQIKNRFGYTTPEECFKDRHKDDQMRARWFNLIQLYSKDDRTRLSKEIFEVNDLYVGCRNHKEFIPTMEQGIADMTIWVDASKRVKPEPKTSMTITREMVEQYPHYIIDNNGIEDDLRANVSRMIKELEL